MDKEMNAWQETLHTLFKHHLIDPKRIAFRLHKHSDYLSDICRRERVDPFAVANEVLKEMAPLAKQDLPRFLAVTGPIISLLLDGTNWMPQYLDPSVEADTSYTKLCKQTGMLCEDMGGAIKSLAEIEEDGKYDETDDVHIAEFRHKVDLLIQRLSCLSRELERRRAQRIQI